MKTISYVYRFESNIGTEEDPNIISSEHGITIGPFFDDRLDEMMDLAKKEAYGEITVDDLPDDPKASYIPTPEQSAVVMMRAAIAQQVKDMENDMFLQCSGLAEPWVPGDHKSGEVYNVEDQTWECFADYDNSTYPDVKPGDPSWFTFNRPLHGKSIETARPWVKPENGTTDIYHSGEYMVFTDGHTYKAKRDTNFSPEEYPADWEKVD